MERLFLDLSTPMFQIAVTFNLEIVPSGTDTSQLSQCANNVAGAFIGMTSSVGSLVDLNGIAGCPGSNPGTYSNTATVGYSCYSMQETRVIGTSNVCGRRHFIF